jgi:hypothetical protein
VNILRKPFGPADLAYRVREVLDAAKGETVANDETLDTATWQA